MVKREHGARNDSCFYSFILILTDGMFKGTVMIKDKFQQPNMHIIYNEVGLTINKIGLANLNAFNYS